MRTLLTPIRPELWAIVLFSTVINVLVVPLYTMHLYDKVLPSHSLPTLVSLTVAATVLVSGMGLLDGFRSQVQIRASSEVDTRLAGRVFEIVMARTPGDGIVQAFSDIKEVRTFLTGPALPAFVDAPWAVLFLSVVFLLHPLMGAVSLAGAAALIGLAMISDARTRQRLAAGSRQQAAGSRQQAAGSRQQAAGSRQQPGHPSRTVRQFMHPRRRGHYCPRHAARRAAGMA